MLGGIMVCNICDGLAVYRPNGICDSCQNEIKKEKILKDCNGKKLKHGDRVTCRIDGVYVHDAKIIEVLRNEFCIYQYIFPKNPIKIKNGDFQVTELKKFEGMFVKVGDVVRSSSSIYKRTVLDVFPNTCSLLQEEEGTLGYFCSSYIELAKDWDLVKPEPEGGIVSDEQIKKISKILTKGLNEVSERVVLLEKLPNMPCCIHIVTDDSFQAGVSFSKSVDSDLSSGPSNHNKMLRCVRCGATGEKIHYNLPIRSRDVPDSLTCSKCNFVAIFDRFLCDVEVDDEGGK